MILETKSIQGDVDQVDLIGMLSVAWKSRYFLLSSVATGAIVAVVMAVAATPIYRAETVIVEVSDKGMGAAASLASQFGGLASLAGLSMVSNGGADRETRAVLGSRRLAEEFIKRQGLLPQLLQGSTGQSSAWRAVKRFREDVLAIREDKRTGLTTVSIEWRDPSVAARWANDFVALANEVIRQAVTAESTRSIKYLNEQVAKTNVLEIQRVMYNLIESQTKTLMLANAKSEYAFAVIDPAVAPEIRVSPRRTFMVFFGILAGLIAGVAVLICRQMILNFRARAPQ